jgi:hypothetical protein
MSFASVTYAAERPLLWKVFLCLFRHALESLRCVNLQRCPHDSCPAGPARVSCTYVRAKQAKHPTRTVHTSCKLITFS